MQMLWCQIINMSIIDCSTEGWLIEHRRSIEETYSHVIDLSKKGEFCYKCPEEMFNIKNQFMMDSQFEAACEKSSRNTNSSKEIAVIAESTCDNVHGQKKKKQKRKLPLNHGEIVSAGFHQKIVDILSRALVQLISLGVQKGALKEKNKDDSIQDNNIDARKFAKIEGDADKLVMLTDMSKHFGDTETQSLTILQRDVNITDSIVNNMVHYDSDTASVKCMLGSDYLIPPKCSFLMSDITFLQPLLQEDKKYDLIVLDPPWENKSIKRKKTYCCLQDTDLQQLPIKNLCSTDCLVLVWVTNKQRQQRYVTEQLFPKWDVTYRTHWYWLKVTKYGEPVVPLNDGMKRPYECMIIGTRGNSISVPKDKVVVSVPCATHSRKPPLHDIMETIFKDYKDIKNCRCLELFARNLLPGWTSWGNEVLLHQHTDFFGKMNT